MRYFEQARQFLPNSSRIPESLAYVARRRGQWDRSESYFNEAERLDPRNVSLLTPARAYLYVPSSFPRSAAKARSGSRYHAGRRRYCRDKRRLSPKRRVTCRGPRRFSLRCIRAPTITQRLEIQAYQAILERRPAPIISPLKEILAKSDPALGYYNGELRFWLGWAQEVAGDHPAAQESWRQARSELEPFLKEQPDNNNLIGDLALTNMGLGDKAAALALAERAMAVIPIEKDAIDGPDSVEIFARVAAQHGRTRPRHRRFAETTLDTVQWRTGSNCRSLLRCSGSIRCSIRCGMIRASKNS